METYLRKDFGYLASRGRSPFHGLANETVIWRLVQDNEDWDRWPDVGLGNVLGSPTVYNYREVRARDGDGVFRVRTRTTTAWWIRIAISTAPPTTKRSF